MYFPCIHNSVALSSNLCGQQNCRCSLLYSGLREHPSRNAELHHAAVAQRSQDPRGRGVDQEEARVQGEAEGKRQQVVPMYST